MISLCWVLGLCKLSAAGTILVFFFSFSPVCGACGNGWNLCWCIAVKLPYPGPGDARDDVTHRCARGH